MKKSLLCFLMILLSISLVACSSAPGPVSSSNTSTNAESSAQQETTSSETIGKTEAEETIPVTNPLGKFEKPVQVHVAMPYDPTDTSLAEGNVESNYY